MSKTSKFVLIGVVLWMGLYAYSAKTRAETIATLPNKAGGKIVITDEPCVINGKSYKNLNRVYNYGSSGYSTEGCWTIEGETVVVVWEDDDKVRRYPIENFTMNSNYSKKKGNNNRGYNY
jgi:hypothetical protein